MRARSRPRDAADGYMITAADGCRSRCNEWREGGVEIQVAG